MAIEWVDISAGHSLPSSLGPILGVRACLGVAKIDASYASFVTNARRRNPTVVILDYLFLTGPRRYGTVQQQVAFYASHRTGDLACIDWEEDTYTDQHTGRRYSFGIRSISEVLNAVALCKARGMRVGVYASRYLLTEDVVRALVKAGVAFIWGAAYDGLTLQDHVLRCGVPVAHQYRGDVIDRDRFFVTVDELRAMAGKTSRYGVAVAKLRVYLARLRRARQTPAVVRKEAGYEKRIEDYQSRG